MNTKLIALVAIAAGTVAAVTADIAAGTVFEVPVDQAEILLTDGKAKLAEEPLAPPPKGKLIKARILADCSHGKCNDVVELPSSLVKQLEADGAADSNKEAVAYAMTLEQNQPKA